MAPENRATARPTAAITPTVLLHGFTHTGASWAPVRARLAALGAGLETIAPDIRGHGEASDAEPVTLKAVIADIRKLTAERFTLVGYSMGGRIALHAALALADRVEQLILIGASPGIADQDERAARREADARLATRIERLTIEEVADLWERDAGATVLAGASAEVRARAREDRLRNTSAGLAAALRALGAGELAPLWDRLHELRMPVLLVVGERDRKFRSIAEQMAERIAGCRHEVVPGAGHAVHLEAPAAVAELLAAPIARAR